MSVIDFTTRRSKLAIFPARLALEAMDEVIHRKVCPNCCATQTEAVWFDRFVNHYVCDSCQTGGAA